MCPRPGPASIRLLSFSSSFFLPTSRLFTASLHPLDPHSTPAGGQHNTTRDWTHPSHVSYQVSVDTQGEREAAGGRLLGGMSTYTRHRHTREGRESGSRMERPPALQQDYDHTLAQVKVFLRLSAPLVLRLYLDCTAPHQPQLA